MSVSQDEESVSGSGLKQCRDDFCKPLPKASLYDIQSLSHLSPFTMPQRVLLGCDANCTHRLPESLGRLQPASGFLGCAVPARWPAARRDGYNVAELARARTDVEIGTPGLGGKRIEEAAMWKVGCAR